MGEDAPIWAKAKNNSLTIGYQHNVIPIASQNMFLTSIEMSKSPSPDKILTTGLKTKAILEKYSFYPKERIVASCALRYQYLYDIKPFQRDNSNKVLLVALEGVWQAAEIVNSLYSQIEGLKEWEVIIRCHPALPLEKLKARFNFDFEKACNFKPSTQSLLKDIEASSCVVYWGSTVALEAIKMGRPVVNIRFPGIDYDPLFDLSVFKGTWHVGDSVFDIIESFIEMSSIEYTEAFNQAVSYINDYLCHCDDSSMSHFLGDNGTI